MKEQDPRAVQPMKHMGRPRVAERMEFVGVSLPRSYVQRLEQLAERRDASLSSVVRELLILRLPRE